MAIDSAAIRAAIIAELEASGSFGYGAFTGQPPQAIAAKLAQTGTATHWFDVVLRPTRRSPASNVSSGNSRRLMEIDVTIPIWSRYQTPVQSTTRATTIAAIVSACEEAAKDLSQPASLATGSGRATGIVGGCLLARDGR
ncbi:MAG TPA: hypothetical protein VHM19_14040, partial [Polyangiales bacterium]|nr:hypothetical protein [Polyangiales bacterium]